MGMPARMVIVGFTSNSRSMMRPPTREACSVMVWAVMAACSSDWFAFAARFPPKAISVERSVAPARRAA